MKMRSGFTVIELVIAVLIAGIVLTAAWSLFSMSQRHRKAADATQQGIIEALAFVQPLEQDFRRLYMDPRHPVDVFTGNERGVEFYVYDDTRSDLDRGVIWTRKITYTFVPGDYTIHRQEEGQPPRKLPGTYESLDFVLEPPYDYLHQPPTSSEPPPTRASGLLTYQVTCLPVELTLVDRERWKPQDRTILKGAVPLTSLNGKRRYYFWNANSTTRAVTSEAELR